LGKQTNNSDQGGPLYVLHVAKLKINVIQGKFILEFAVILIKQCSDKQWR